MKQTRLDRMEFYTMKTKETLQEAFGNRFFGFSTLVLLPAAYMIVLGFNYIGAGIFIYSFIYILFWLGVIRFTL